MYLSFFFHCVAEGNLFELKKLIFFLSKTERNKTIMCRVALLFIIIN